MTRYVVLKRSDGDGWMPGMIVTDPVEADRVVERGFLQALPDDLEDQLPKADEKAAKAATKAEAKAQRDQEAEDERIRKEGEAALLANRPDAKKLSEAMDVPLDEVFQLSQDDYEKGVDAFLTNPPEEPAAASESASPTPDIKVGAAADDKSAESAESTESTET